MSRVFQQFLAQEVAGILPATSDPGSAWWGAQDQEGVTPDAARFSLSPEQTETLLQHHAVQTWLRQRRGIVQSLLTGDGWLLDTLRTRYRFLIIVSPPRTGGTYLTKNLYRALGVDPQHLPAYFAHDGFPHVPLDGSGRDESLAQFAEWLLMAQHFLPRKEGADGHAVVVLKTVKWVWDLATYVDLLGDAAEWIWVDRPEDDVFSSICEKAGKPIRKDQPLQPKINIEQWIAEYEKAYGSDGESVTAWQAFQQYYQGYRSRLLSQLPPAQTTRLSYQATAIEGYLRTRVALFSTVSEFDPFIVKHYRGKSANQSKGISCKS